MGRERRGGGAAYEAFRRGDLEGVAKQFADNVEWESPDTLPNGGVTRGRDRG